MSEVKILYNGYQAIIQYQSNEKMKDIFKRFKIKINGENKELVYLYNGEMIKDENIIVSNLTSEKIFTILAYDSNNLPSNNIIKSEYIICPICKRSAILDEKEYKLLIYGCQNEHITNNILIKDFNKYQEIDYSKIICKICNINNRNNTYNNEFYKCDECKIDICPMCKSKHDNNHKIINYNEEEYKCNIHNEYYYSYSKECKRNICMICENNHNEHEIIYYGKIIIEENKIKEKMNELKEEIDKFNKDIEEKINKLKKIKENIEEYYKIINDIIKKYINNKKRNYQILINIKNIINNNIIINNIKRINNNKNKYEDIIDIYNKIYNINNNNNINNNIKDDLLSNKKNTIKDDLLKHNKNNEILNNNKNKDNNIIIYKIDKDRIKIFGYTFVQNNKNNIKLEIEGNEYELMEF